MKYIRKDITTIRGPAILAHGVNCQNVMGSGVAKALYTKWPEVKEAYHRNHRFAELGGVLMVKVEPDIFVANCYTQQAFGYDGKPYASVEAISECMGRLVRVVQNIRHPDETLLCMPRIGCGLGGLDWESDVCPELLSIEDRTGVEFTICDLW